MAAQQQQSLSIDDQLQQLGAARALVLADPVYWPQVVTGILPIVSGPSIELRRWGADFLAETFSTPVVDPKEKSKLALVCLDTLARLIEEKETGILKSAVQCSASVYPLIFRHICNNREDVATWNTMDSIKSKILSLWDSAPVGARVCCIKFVQRVILVQSKGFTDPRLADRSETSLSMVPTNHPLLSLPSLDAEAQGLLDRLLSIFHEDPSDPILITATLNNLASLIKTRLPLAPKIVGTILAFNPLAMASRASFISIKMRLMCQCMEKTVRVLLLNIMRSNPNGPFTGKISQHLSRLSQAKADLNEQASRKREAPVQEVEATKRLKIENTGAPNSSTSTPIQTPPRQPIVPTPVQQAITGPLTYAQLFTLSTDVAMTSFDGQQLPIDLVLQIVIGSIYSMSQSNLDAAITAVRDRYNALLQASPPQAPLQAPSAALDQARAEPEPHENAQIHPKTEKEEEEEEDRGLQLGAFRLPTPPGLATEQLQQASLEAVDRMFTVIEEFEKISLVSKKKQLGVNRLAASNWDRDGWIMFLTRLATRGSSGINSEAISVKSEDGNASGLESSPALSAAIRERLYSYVITDFRGRLDIAVAWLNEEWYTDTIMARTDEGKNREPQYCKWMMKIMDGIFPYLESKDRMFMRLLSEIPEITLEVLGKVKMLCLDPDRAALGIQMLHYLAMLRPPVRGMCLDVLEDLWQNHPEVRTPAQKLLQKWRPEALVPRIKSEEYNPVIKDEGSNGVSQAHGNGATPVNA